MDVIEMNKGIEWVIRQDGFSEEFVNEYVGSGINAGRQLTTLWMTVANLRGRVYADAFRSEYGVTPDIFGWRKTAGQEAPTEEQAIALNREVAERVRRYTDALTVLSTYAGRVN